MILSFVIQEGFLFVLSFWAVYLDGILQLFTERFKPEEMCFQNPVDEA